MINPIYRFMLRAGSVSATATEIYPVWKDDLSLDYAQESEQQFLRAQLSGTIDLINEDYDLVMSHNFGTVFYVDIQKSNNMGQSFTHYWRGKFTLTDCQINADDKRLKVRLTVVDQYNDILAGLDKEYDLIKLAPAIQKVLIRKRPCIQIYDEGDSVVTTIVGNVSFEQAADVPSDVSNVDRYLRERCHFATMTEALEISIQDAPTAYESDLSLPFSGVIAGNNSVLTNPTDTFYINYFESKEYYYDTDTQMYIWRYTNGLSVIQRSSGNEYWRFEQTQDYRMPDIPGTIDFTNSVTGLDHIHGNKTSHTVYGRILCSVENFGRDFTQPLYDNDLVGENKNYRRAIGYSEYAALVSYAGYSTSPTEYGRRDDGYYFIPPNMTGRYVPVGRSRWVNTSLWIDINYIGVDLEMQGNYAYFINDCYPLDACLSVLLAQIAPSLSFAATTTYSQFLYSATDPIGGRSNKLLFTPKSNIVNGEYQTPAQTAPVTLRMLLNFLRDTYRCYWYVDEYNRLHIEHIEYFRRGGTYGSQYVSLDLTTRECRRNGKKWAFHTNSYEYDKQDMPERYQFGWMDKSTQFFTGYPIEVQSPYVEQGKIEEVEVSSVTTDLDFMLINPSAISPDGFVVLNVEAANFLNGSTVLVGQNTETASTNIASYASGKSCALDIYSAGSGDITIVWYKGNSRVVSSYTYTISQQRQTVYVDIPDGVTAMAFLINGSATIYLYSITVVNDSSIQVTTTYESINGVGYSLQNGFLSFLKLQRPYWLYNMPASQLKINGTTYSALSIAKGKKQTLNVPVGNDDPNMQRLIKTGLGYGMVQSMSIRLTTRMAKTTLKYDTE